MSALTIPLLNYSIACADWLIPAKARGERKALWKATNFEISSAYPPNQSKASPLKTSPTRCRRTVQPQNSERGERQLTWSSVAFVRRRKSSRAK
jgi:hypothetical protein